MVGFEIRGLKPRVQGFVTCTSNLGFIWSSVTYILSYIESV